jgi:beta-lactamase superfamily II metal-dependent hydrolase
MRRLLLALGVVLAAALPAFGQAAPPKTLTVDVLDVGQGDSILIRTPEGKTALIDAGPSKKVAELLRERGVTGLDLLVISHHHHQDHYGGAAEVVKRFKPRAFLASDSGHTTPNYLRLLEVVRDSGATPLFPTGKPRRIELGSVLLTVFPQAPEDTEEENNNSVGIRLQYGGFSMLFPGDGEETERAWWESQVPDLVKDSTVLKVAHHGSRNGTDLRWLLITQPHLAVGSMGKANPFHHPHPETVALLERAGVPFYRTDRDGTVTIATDGKRWQVTRETETARRAPAETKRPAAEESPAESRGSRVDLNTATQGELEALPGIGPTLARRIMEARPFRSVEDLDRVKGIGPKRLAELRPLVRVE